MWNRNTDSVKALFQWTAKSFIPSGSGLYSTVYYVHNFCLITYFCTTMSFFGFQMYIVIIYVYILYTESKLLYLFMVSYNVWMTREKDIRNTQATTLIIFQYICVWVLWMFVFLLSPVFYILRRIAPNTASHEYAGFVWNNSVSCWVELDPTILTSPPVEQSTSAYAEVFCWLGLWVINFSWVCPERWVKDPAINFAQI